MKKIIVFFLICFLMQQQANAQLTRYIIKLKDKAFSGYSLANPQLFLTSRAIQRREKYGIPVDSTDLPVTERYLDSIRMAGAVTILNYSKWLNQVAIKTTDAAALAKINAFPFVAGSTAIASFTNGAIQPVNKYLEIPENQVLTGDAPESSLTDQYDYGFSHGQVAIHNGQFLHNLGFMGQGMQIAVLDAGFYHYQNLPTFDSIRINNQILGTWDFVKNEESVNEDHQHGMQCLSTIAANMPGMFVGTAPKASFYLYRTEDANSEYPIEEQNWAVGAERADSLGVDVYSVSLGYTTFDDPALNYTYNNMDGNTTMIAKAADLAAKKGILVVVAAGNEGTSSWHYLSTPSDADSVLAVGAVDSLGNIAGFSSYGPSSDNRIKPNVASVGLMTAVANTSTGMPVFGSGTSFACPNMAGLSTCLWQAFPEVNNMSIIDALQQSASRFSNPDNRVGYGIPDVKKAFVLLVKKLFQAQVQEIDCIVTGELQIKTGNSINVAIERKINSDPEYQLIKSFTGSGNFATQSLAFTDDLSQVPNGNIYYRIKMQVQGDTSFIIDSILIAHTQSCLPLANSVKMGPNPLQDQLQVIISRTANTSVTLVLFNALGQKIWHVQNNQLPGSQIYKIPTSQLAKGVYSIAFYANGKREWIQKLIK